MPQGVRGSIDSEPKILLLLLPDTFRQSQFFLGEERGLHVWWNRDHLLLPVVVFLLDTGKGPEGQTLRAAVKPLIYVFLWAWYFTQKSNR